MPKFRYCSQAACFSSLAEVHRRSPEHSGLTGSRAACLQFMRCGLLLHNRVQKERDRQPHPGRRIYSQYLGQWKDPCRTLYQGPQSARQNLAWESHSLLCGGREQRSVKGSKRAQGEQISPALQQRQLGRHFCWRGRWEML